MKVRPTHDFDLSPKEAIALQKQLVDQLILEGRVEAPRYVAGVDAAFLEEEVVGAAVVWDRQRDELIEQRSVRCPLTFPYVPGLLSFREGAAVIEALRALEHPVEAVLFDGAGFAHPRRLGIASHVGLFLDVPTVGVAKSRLCGEHREPGVARGQTADLVLKGERIGQVVRSRTDVRPLYISPGHRISIDGATQLTLACCTRYRLPEPTRLADHLSKSAKHD